MSNHFSSANLRFPGNDRRLDLTDVFAFASSQDPDNTVLIIDSNPTSAPPPIQAQARGPEFYPGAVYRINVDTDGDAHADVAFTFVFSAYDNGGQTGTAWYATGAGARQPGRPGRCSPSRSRSASTARPGRRRVVNCRFLFILLPFCSLAWTRHCAEHCRAVPCPGGAKLCARSGPASPAR